MIYRKIMILALALMFTAGLTNCDRPDAYEDEADGGVEYGVNTQAEGYEDPAPFTADSLNRINGESQVDTSYDLGDDRRYTEQDGTWPADTDAERDEDY